MYYSITGEWITQEIILIVQHSQTRKNNKERENDRSRNHRRNQQETD